MRNLYKILIASTLIGFTSTGCSNFLDREPLARETTETFVSDPDNLELMVIAGYDPIQWRFDGVQFYNYFIFGDIASDDADKGGLSETDLDYMTLVQKFQWNPAEPLFESVWKRHFAGVFRANTVLSNIEVAKSIVDESVYNQIRGEGLFLRGWHYFQLTKMFGGVPLFTSLEDYENLNTTGRSTESEVYDVILQDFKEAGTLLKLKSQYDENYLGRATSGMAKSYFAKAALYSKDESTYEEAYNLAKEVIGTGEYALLEDYTQIWRLEEENGSESIFEIQYEPSNFNNWSREGEGAGENMMQSPRAGGNSGNDSAIGEGWGFNLPTAALEQAFRDAGDDIRREQTIIYDGEEVYEGEPRIRVAQPGDNDSDWYNTTGFAPQKYFLPQRELTAGFGDNRYNGHSNYRMFRYADLLLFASELALETGKGDAATYLNEVRARVGLDAIAAPTLQDVYNERRLELALEGHRFFDQVRTGQITTELANEGYVQGVHEKFPIPQSEIDLTDGLIVGNPSN
ncbi:MULTISPECIES: RagB/SusD family nutrient uptake outer membrane protein [Flammeovirga]|uniref:RagB/SusD family nutrient uptake outer membrane protein n=1 Tax=Flammeovirga agarivorans TaxID=2726742 RepID=A0A7X8SR19_9BACT|nr:MULTISPECIES: RagB/SusD family nutrient uptake outer membrane protein [Flammeovirga]NLR94826.1 RagB/SusD family nutrient uptake outer membrane protein [Flammeovirga agarivorans]